MNTTTSRCSSLSLVVARRRFCGYPAAVKPSVFCLTPCRFHHQRRRSLRAVSPQPQVTAALAIFSTWCCRFPDSHFFTGNSLFSRMEVVKRTYAFLLTSTLLHVSQNRFCTGSSITKNKQMVEHLRSYGAVKSKKVADVMEMIDRALFVPEGAPPYVDSPLQIGYNATISAPHMHAMCLELLENHLKPGMHALDVGSGSGYLTACFAVMVGPQGRAVGVEHIPELVASSIVNIRKSLASPLLKDGSLSVHVGDGRKGWPEFAPYDAIHVGAAAPEIPPSLIEQLKPGGRLVIPVGNIFQDLQVVDKSTDGTLTVNNHTSVRYVPLTSREAQIRGY